MNAAINAALSDTRVKAYAQANGWELVGGSRKVLADVVAADMAEFPGLIKKLDLKTEGSTTEKQVDGFSSDPKGRSARRLREGN